MADKTSKTWMDVGETDDPNAVIESYEAEAAVEKGDPVYLSSDHKVSPAAAAQNCIGVAVKAAAAGAQAPILKRGRVKVVAGGAITRGGKVYGADADQKVLALADVSQAVDEGGAAKYTVLVYLSRGFARAEETADAEDDLIFIDVGA